MGRVSESTPPGPPPPDPSGSSSGEAPYGAPPFPPAGQAPYGQAPANPYGAPPPPPNPYGGQQPNPYAAGPYAPQPAPPPTGPLGDGLDMYGRPLGNDTRPANVSIAAWVTWIFAGLSLVLYAFLTLALLVAKDSVTREIDKQILNSDQPVSFSAQDAYGFILAMVLVATFWCLLTCVLAVFVMRRSNTARILLVISASIAGLISLLGIASIVSAVPLLACVAVVVLLFTGGCNDWFAGRRRL